MIFKARLTALVLATATVAAGQVLAAPVKATVVYGNKIAVVDTDTKYPVRAFRVQVQQATGIDAKYMYLQVLPPKPAVLTESEKTLESYALYTDFRVVARAQAEPNP